MLSIILGTNFNYSKKGWWEIEWTSCVEPDFGLHTRNMGMLNNGFHCMKKLTISNKKPNKKQKQTNKKFHRK